MSKKRNSGLRKIVITGMLSLLSTGTGCSLQEALVDGFYGGISDTIAAIVSGAALGTVAGDVS